MLTNTGPIMTVLRFELYVHIIGEDYLGDLEGFK